MIDRALPVPLYHQVKGILIRKIKTGELKPEDRLPSEDELAEHHGVSKATIRQALAELAIEGLVRREQGRGTFVSGAKVNVGPRELTSFTQEMRKRHKHPSSRILESEVIEAQGEVAEKLGLKEGAPVFCLKRLRLADDRPMGIQTAYVPLALAPGLEDFPEGASLYEFLQGRHKLVPARAKEIHRAVALDPADAALLGAAEGTPGLAAERITYLESGRPFELVHSVMRGDLYEIMLDLVTPPVR
jgi:GntR family transcriptional regulator